MNQEKAGSNLETVAASLRAKYGNERVDEQLAHMPHYGEAIDDPELWLRHAVEGAFKFMPIERVDVCTCGSPSLEHLSRFVYWNLLGVRVCRECESLCVSPRLTGDSLAKVFNTTYFDYEAPEYWGERRATVFRDVFRLLAPYRRKRLFDVGTAFGHFVKAANDRGYQASGCDISEQAVKWGRERYGLNLHHGVITSLELPEQSTDVVVSLDALYYSPDPVADLKAMRKLLSNDGVILLRLRNGNGAIKRGRREGKRPVGEGFFPLEHLWSFTPKSITKLLDKAGFIVDSLTPAASSKTRLSPILNLGFHTHRLAMTALPKLPIATRSFNVVARRA